MFDDSPADDNDRPYDYADANDPDEEWVAVPPPGTGPWFGHE